MSGDDRDDLSDLVYRAGKHSESPSAGPLRPHLDDRDLRNLFGLGLVQRPRVNDLTIETLARMVGIANAHSPIPPAPTTMLAALQSARVVLSPSMPDGEWRQYRFPKSKRRRIRKKWAKDRRNYRWVLVPAMFRDQRTGTIYANTPAYTELMRAVPAETEPNTLDHILWRNDVP